ncbi:hypothetical protein FIU89_14700 [Roseovarius sp. THAF27]|nr:hypothetical protein FIU89_14700 [Roseovarius sp. THAF27]
MHDYMADVQKARRLAVIMFRTSAEEGLRVGEAIIMTRRYLEHMGYPAPDDPLAFATDGRVTMQDAPLGSQFYCKPNGEVL